MENQTSANTVQRPDGSCQSQKVPRLSDEKSIDLEYKYASETPTQTTSASNPPGTTGVSHT